MVRIVTILGLALLLGCGSKNSHEECDRACRNYFKLRYWAEAEPLIAAAPEGERAALRKQKEIDLEDRQAQGLALCHAQCEKGAKSEEIKCMTEAKTIHELEKCGVTAEK